MKSKPMHLNLFVISFPITAIVSILHRISGIIIFLAIPIFLWLLQESLGTKEQFLEIHKCLESIWFKFIVTASLAAILYHSIAGIRHLIMDLGFGESKTAGKASASLVLIVTIVTIAAIGYLLW